MAVYFYNKSEIDLDAIRVMGVSVKEGKNPIGYFGTGLKFSLATLIRFGQKVSLCVGGKELEFYATDKKIRGEAFEVVMMGDEQLPFTTQLGRNWQMWQAYRELYCNAEDEGGSVSNELPEGDWGTVIKVSGDLIEDCHSKRSSTFIQGSPDFADDDCEIFDRPSAKVFYRGVRAHDLQSPTVVTYNIKSALELTEDRTIKHVYSMLTEMIWAATRLNDRAIIERVLLAPDGSLESKFDYEPHHPFSNEFLKAIGDLHKDPRINKSAVEAWRKKTGAREVLKEATLDDFELLQITDALDLLRELSCPLERDEFKVVETLGSSVYGQYANGEILISKRTLDMGTRFLASTLYEEYLHKEHGFVDESRDLQNYLFERLLTMAEKFKLQSEPKRVAA